MASIREFILNNSTDEAPVEETASFAECFLLLTAFAYRKCGFLFQDSAKIHPES